MFLQFSLFTEVTWTWLGLEMKRGRDLFRSFPASKAIFHMAAKFLDLVVLKYEDN